VTVSEEVRIDTGAHAVLWNGLRAQLIRREWQMLLALANGSGRFVSKRDLSQAIWHDDEHIVAVEVTIHRLRRKLKEQAELIENAPGEGYRLRGTLVEDVEEAAG
jgi:two-component system response regulator QseB